MGAEPIESLSHEARAGGTGQGPTPSESTRGQHSEELASPPSVARDCPFCMASLLEEAQKCRHCGEWVARPCKRCGTSLRGKWAARGICVECEGKKSGTLVRHHSGLVAAEPRSKSVAALTSFFLGGLGSHRFYLGDPFTGLFYLVFCWTFIPSLIGMIEGVRFAVMEDEEFQRRYSGKPLD
ncbi:MAG: TM2 domain-containing protein [Gemmatimonadetes bacterium]|nr:TM2 domain-containing protein [Gemmatimonadota bacterium]